MTFCEKQSIQIQDILLSDIFLDSKLSTKVITECNTKGHDFRGIRMRGIITLAAFRFYGVLDLRADYLNSNLRCKFTLNLINA